MFPRHTDDLFESEKVSSLGEDILAKVIEHEQHICDIVIESKHVAQWQNKFIEELRKHMRDRNTQCGILVTSKMPHNALNPHLYITEDGLWVVHIDVAVIAYKALRDLVVRLKQAAASSEQASQIYAEFVQVITSGEYQGKFDAIASTIIRLKGAITKVQNNAVKGCSEALGIAGEIEQGIADIQDTNRGIASKAHVPDLRTGCSCNRRSYLYA